MWKHIAAVCLLVLVMMGAVQGASITANPFHLTLDNGANGTTTISWSNPGWNEVWCSVDGGADVGPVTAGNGSGSTSINWISYPSNYVFKLYSGTTHSTLVKWTSVTTQRSPNHQFGFNYLPEHLDWFKQGSYAGQWNRLMQDLITMSSAKGGVIRFNIWCWVGCSISSANGGTWNYGSDFYVFKDNLVNWLANACYPNDVRVVVAFHNDWLTYNHWQGAYGTNFGKFLGDTNNWINQIVNAIEGNANAKKMVFAYDYYNEVYSGVTNMEWYMEYLYDWSAIPMGKRTFSMSSEKDKLGNWATWLDGRRYDYVDLHFYPDATPSTDDPSKVSQYVTAARNAFPQSTILMGEYGWKGGSSFPNNEGSSPKNEDTQSSKCTALITNAKNAGVMCSMAWDFIPAFQRDGAEYSFAYNKNQPKDVFGALNTFAAVLPNSDFESVSGGKPSNWGYGGSIQNYTVSSSGPNGSDACTNNYYGRIQMNSGSSSYGVWFTQNLSVGGGQRLYLNGYVRGNQYIYVGVHEYDQNWNYIQTQATSAVVPSGWQWYSIQHLEGPWLPILHANTRNITVFVTGYGSGNNPSYLDVDNMQCWVRPGN